MRCWVLALAGCGFSNSVTGDAGVVDVPIDQVDAPVPLRVTDGLIGFWTFNEASGAEWVLDTSNHPMPIALEVVTSATIAAPAFELGNVRAANPARIISEPNPHLSTDPVTSGGVTFEIWLRPGLDVQGTTTSPRFIAGIAGSVTTRNVVFLHAGDKWIGRVRTSAALDGTPDLVATNPPSTTFLTHLTLVADATQRALYVDGQMQASTAPGAPVGWDATYPMAIFDEPQHARQWLGTIALIAMYDRALTPAEVKKNYDLGPDAP